MFHTYVFIDPRTRTPFYVGKGRPSSTRIRRHLQNGSHAKPVHATVAAIRAAGLEPVVLNAELECENDALELERLLIADIGRIDRGTGPLLNRTAGGQGATERVGFKQSAESKALIAASIRGKKRTPETRARMREAALRRLTTDEGQATFIRWRAAPKVLTEKGREAMRAVGRRNVALATAAASDSARRRREGR
jgi:hypothetical protein